MPNRLLRDWTNSDKVDMISFQAEVFFVRLIMNADDYGCFWGDGKRLKSNLFPLKSDSIRDADILRWLAECQKAGLIVVYESDGKKYLQIVDFGQRLRIKRRKFPENESGNQKNDRAIPSSDSNMRLEGEEELEGEEKWKEGATHDLSKSNLFRKSNPPTFEKVHEVFLNNGGTVEMAQKFFDTHQATEWFLRGSPIKNFISLVPGYINSWNKNNFKNGGSHQAGNATGSGGKGTSEARIDKAKSW